MASRKVRTESDGGIDQTRPRPTKRDDERARKVSFKKRKDSIKKKSMELSILCDTKVCTIISGPDGDVYTWPENSTEVKDIIQAFREKERQGQVKNKVQPSDVYCEKKKKIEREIDGVSGGSLEKLLQCWDDNLVGKLSRESAIDLVDCLDSKIKEITSRIEFLKAMNEKKGLRGKEVAEFNGEGWNEMSNLKSNVMMMSDSAIMGHDLFGQPFQILGPNSFETVTVQDIQVPQPLKTLDPITSSWLCGGGGGDNYSFYSSDHMGRTIGSGCWPLEYCYGNMEVSNSGDHKDGFSTYLNELVLNNGSFYTDVASNSSGLCFWPLGSCNNRDITSTQGIDNLSIEWNEDIGSNYCYDNAGFTSSLSFDSLYDHQTAQFNLNGGSCTNGFYLPGLEFNLYDHQTAQFNLNGGSCTNGFYLPGPDTFFQP